MRGYPDRQIEEDIQHLDFDVKEQKTHYDHPIDDMLFWCGERRPGPGIGPARDTKPSEINCVGCLHLYIKHGGLWWWNVRRAWYGPDA